MKVAALIYLQGDPIAQRLVMAWPLLKDRSLKDASIVAWAALAGTYTAAARERAPVLVAHEICRKDGTVDPLAESYIANQASKGLKLRGKKEQE